MKPLVRTAVILTSLFLGAFALDLPDTYATRAACLAHPPGKVFNEHISPGTLDYEESRDDTHWAYRLKVVRYREKTSKALVVEEYIFTPKGKGPFKILLNSELAALHPFSLGFYQPCSRSETVDRYFNQNILQINNDSIR